MCLLATRGKPTRQNKGVPELIISPKRQHDGREEHFSNFGHQAPDGSPRNLGVHKSGQRVPLALMCLPALWTAGTLMAVYNRRAEGTGDHFEHQVLPPRNMNFTLSGSNGVPSEVHTKMGSH